MCEIDAYSSLSAAYRIVLENFVTLAENVHIADYRYEEENLGLAQQDREVLWEARGVHIGRAASIGANVSIEGAVHIGRGSTRLFGYRTRNSRQIYWQIINRNFCMAYSIYTTVQVAGRLPERI